MDFAKYSAGEITYEELMQKVMAMVDVNTDKAAEVLAALISEDDNGTDRGVAIVGGAFTEKLLESLLLAYFKFGSSRIGFSRSEKEVLEISASLFDYNRDGALSTFAAKTRVARLLGLINHDTYKNLRNVASIRNDFAHDLDIDSFKNPKVQAKVNKLIPTNRTQDEPQGKGRRYFATVLQSVFVALLGMTAMLENGLPVNMSQFADR